MYSVGNLVLSDEVSLYQVGDRLYVVPNKLSVWHQIESLEIPLKVDDEVTVTKLPDNRKFSVTVTLDIVECT